MTSVGEDIGEKLKTSSSNRVELVPDPEVVDILRTGGPMKKWVCPREGCDYSMRRKWLPQDSAGSAWSAPHCTRHGYPRVAMVLEGERNTEISSIDGGSGDGVQCQL